MRDIKTEIINTEKRIGDLVDWLVLRHAPPAPPKPTMYIDIEGVDLCREGSLSILTLLLDTETPTTRVYLIDVHSLGPRAFTTPGTRSQTLQDVLQNSNMPKVFFDARNDSDALFALFGVALQGVHDVQLLESATRTTTSSRKYLSGLAKCVESSPSGGDKQSWKRAKQTGERLFKAAHGGSQRAFEQRPIPADLVSYCVGDVEVLPLLWDKYRANTTKRWRDLVGEETKRRVETSWKPEYQPHGADRTLAPWSKEQNKLLDELNYVPTLEEFCEFVEEDMYDDDGLGEFWELGEGDICDDDGLDEFWELGEDDIYDADDLGYFHEDVDDGPTSVRDILNDEDIRYYYSD